MSDSNLIHEGQTDQINVCEMEREKDGQLNVIPTFAPLGDTRKRGRERLEKGKRGKGYGGLSKRTRKKDKLMRK